MVYETVRALADYLKKRYPEASIYDAPVLQKLTLPCFFITVLQITEQKTLKHHYQREIPIAIDYLPNDQISGYTDEVYCVQEAFGESFKLFECQGAMLRVKDKTISYDKEERVLHVQFTLSVREVLPTHEPSMKELKLKEGVKQDD